MSPLASTQQRALGSGHLHCRRHTMQTTPPFLQSSLIWVSLHPAKAVPPQTHIQQPHRPSPYILWCGGCLCEACLNPKELSSSGEF